MEFKVFLKKRREALRLTQQQVAEALSLRGHEASPARVGHWETGRNDPPIENSQFREALATILQMDVNEMMSELGFIVSEEQRSPEAQVAAAIVDHLPPDARQLALDYLYVLEKRFVQNN